MNNAQAPAAPYVNGTGTQNSDAFKPAITDVTSRITALRAQIDKDPSNVGHMADLQALMGEKSLIVATQTSTTKKIYDDTQQITQKLGQ